ncbi:MAG: hypothetical protein JW727_02010 [Candidatus Aenigmarchaeota archaeon]|nr:hypothetical protein [Candidatus Aenigmarchaeota archaeon]
MIKLFFADFLVVLLILSPAFADASPIDFSSPTPVDGSILRSSRVEINSTLQAFGLQELTLEWGGTNYTIYDDSLVLAMDFDNMSAWADFSTYANNATIHSASWTDRGRYGGAMWLDGVDDYLSETDVVNTTGSWTYCAWARNDNGSITASKLLFANRPSPNIFMFYIANSSNGTRLRVGLWNLKGDSVTTIMGGEVLPVGEYFHVCFGYDSTDGNFSIYVNGKPDASQKWLDMADSMTNTLYIGYGYGGTDRYWQGAIDEIRIFSRSLTGEEIRMIYQTNLRRINATDWGFYANLTDLPDGEYSFRLWARDASGNISQSLLRHFSVEATNPQVSIGPVSFKTLSGRPVLAIMVNSTDLSLNYTLIQAANSTGEILNSTEVTENGSFLAELEVPYESQYILTATAYDLAGNTNQSTRVYNMDTLATGDYFLNVLSRKPTLTIGGFALTLGIALLIAVLLVFALWKHNKKGRKKKKEAVLQLRYTNN